MGKRETEVTSERGDLQTAGNPEMVSASNLGGCPTEQNKRRAENWDWSCRWKMWDQRGRRLDGEHPCASVSGRTQRRDRLRTATGSITTGRARAGGN